MHSSNTSSHKSDVLIIALKCLCAKTKRDTPSKHTTRQIDPRQIGPRQNRPATRPGKPYRENRAGIPNFIRAGGRLIDEDNDFAKEYFKVANKNNKNRCIYTSITIILLYACGRDPFFSNAYRIRYEFV